MWFYFQTVVTIVKCYLEISQKDKQNASWKSTVSDDDVSRFCMSELSLDKVKDSETKRRSQYDVELWLTRSPFFMQMFNRVLYKLFPVVAVSINTKLVRLQFNNKTTVMK